MRKAIAAILIAVLLISALVGSMAAGLLSNDQQGPQSEHSAMQPTAPPSLGSESNRPEPVETADLYPVLDLDYDDSWVANVPESIGGYRVLTVDTPKSEACSDEPLITFHATQKSLDEFLAAPLDIPSLRAAVLAISGVPSDIGLSFAAARLDETGVRIDKEEWEARRKSRNENIARIGCLDYRIFLGGRPLSSATPVVPGGDPGLADAEGR